MTDAQIEKKLDEILGDAVQINMGDNKVVLFLIDTDKYPLSEVKNIINYLRPITEARGIDFAIVPQEMVIDIDSMKVENFETIKEIVQRLANTKHGR